MGGNSGLEDLSLCGIAAKQDFRVLASGIDDVNRDGMAGIKMPKFVGLDAVEAGEIVALEQEINGGRRGGTIRLAVIAAFGVRFQMELFD